jgi:hypothetical protein
MKSNTPQALGDQYAFGGPDADVRDLVACYAAIWRCSLERRVAGKAIARNFGMGGD